MLASRALEDTPSFHHCHIQNSIIAYPQKKNSIIANEAL
jgi:hypothetical protein